MLELRSIASIADLSAFVNLGETEFLVSIASIFLLVFAHFLTRGGDQPILKIAKLPVYIRWPLYYALLIIIVFFGVFESSEFIYFQF